MNNNLNYFQQESERLTFRRLTPSDIPKWLNFFNDNDRLHFLGLDKTKSNEELAKGWIMKQFERYENDGLGLLAAELKESQQLIGMCGILVRQLAEQQEYEIAYSLIPTFWKKGYGTEMAKQMKNLGKKILIQNALFPLFILII